MSFPAMLVINIRSLFTKFSDLLLVLHWSIRFHTSAKYVQESWLKSNIVDPLVFLDNFKIRECFKQEYRR